jgi:hypothetical protein
LRNQLTSQHVVIKFVVFGELLYDNEVAADTAADIDLSKSFIASTSSLSSAGLAPVASKSKIASVVQDAAANAYILTQTGKRAIGEAAQIAPNAPVLPAAVLNRFATEQPISLPVLMKPTNSTQVYLVRNAQKRLTDGNRSNFSAELPDAAVQEVALV